MKTHTHDVSKKKLNSTRDRKHSYVHLLWCENNLLFDYPALLHSLSFYIQRFDDLNEAFEIEFSHHIPSPLLSDSVKFVFEVNEVVVMKML